eukprot:1102243-Pelagomonas_calceolata.AAC.5
MQTQNIGLTCEARALSNVKPEHTTKHTCKRVSRRRRAHLDCRSLAPVKDAPVLACKGGPLITCLEHGYVHEG